jgi:hypothetical protein
MYSSAITIARVGEGYFLNALFSFRILWIRFLDTWINLLCFHPAVLAGIGEDLS